MGSGPCVTVRENGRLGPIEWATAGRPLPGEHVSGDQPIAVGIDDDAALFGVIDGLGHGPDAATAAMRAVDVLKNACNERLEVLVQLCHRVLAGSQGAAITLARVDFESRHAHLDRGRQRHRTPGRQGRHGCSHPIQRTACRRHRRLPNTRDQTGAGRFAARRRPDRHRYRRHRRRSSGPHRFRQRRPLL